MTDATSVPTVHHSKRLLGAGNGGTISLLNGNNNEGFSGVISGNGIGHYHHN